MLNTTHPHALQPEKEKKRPQSVSNQKQRFPLTVECRAPRCLRPPSLSPAPRSPPRNNRRRRSAAAGIPSNLPQPRLRAAKARDRYRCCCRRQRPRRCNRSPTRVRRRTQIPAAAVSETLPTTPCPATTGYLPPPGFPTSSPSWVERRPVIPACRGIQGSGAPGTLAVGAAAGRD